MRVGLLAAVADEWNSLLPWLAHHLAEGFDPIVLADMGSDDETTRLLQALAKEGWIDLHPVGRDSQEDTERAIEVLFAEAQGTCDVFVALELDEYLVSHDATPVVPHLIKLFAKEDVGAVAINRRTFVVEGLRLRAAGESRSDVCLKPWDARHYVARAAVRCSLPAVGHQQGTQYLEAARYVHVDGTTATVLVSEGWSLVEGIPLSPAMTTKIVMSPVTVHHHVRTSVTDLQLRGNPAVQEPPVYYPGGFHADDLCRAESLRSETTLLFADKIALSLARSSFLLTEGKDLRSGISGGSMENRPREISIEELRLLEARRDLLQARAEVALLREQSSSSLQELEINLKASECLRGSLSEQLEESRARISEVEEVLHQIFSSRRWRLWNSLRYLGRQHRA
jgi:hypothetical protein